MHLAQFSRYDWFDRRLAAAAFLIAFIFGLFGVVSANAETRTLRMYYGHSKESTTITFKRNGKYVKSGLRKANRFLRDWRRKEPTRMDPALLDLVWEVYQASGSRQVIQVISGYRSPKTNNMLRRRGRKVAKSSQHTRGKALDFFLKDVSVSKLRALGLKAHRGGVGYYRGSFVHLDTGRVRHWPRMSKRQLAKIFPRGKTIHVPSNGRPLKGYKIAMANLKRGLNADGSRRSTSVRQSLLARMFKSSGNDGDESEGKASKDRGRSPAPRKKKPQPVVVASRKPEKAKSEAVKGPDPFSLDSGAVSKAQKRREADEKRKLIATEKARAIELAKLVDEKAAREIAERALEETQVASLLPTRVAVPRLRPSGVATTQLALAAQNSLDASSLTPATGQPSVLDPVGATELALATPSNVLPSAAESVLRPRVDVGEAKPVAQAPVKLPPVILPPVRRDVEGLKSRITTALAKPRETVAAQQANTQLALALSSLPVPKTAASRARLQSSSTNNVASQSAAPRLAVPVPKMPDVQNRPVLSASLQQPTSDPFNEVGKPTLRSRFALTEESADTTASETSAKVTVPSAKPLPGKKAVGEPVQIDTQKPILAELSLGDLDGRAVKAWAVAVTTRVGPTANLRAPKYRQGTRRAAPASVYSLGFAFKRAPLRADRFSGRALTRVAFAHFGSRN